MSEEPRLREQRIAENEAIFRDSNRRLEERYRELGIETDQIPLLCECGNERCTHVVTLARSEYDDARSHPAYFVIAPGHQLLDSERIVWEGDGFSVVEKGGSVLRIVQEIEESLFQ